MHRALLHPNQKCENKNRHTRHSQYYNIHFSTLMIPIMLHDYILLVYLRVLSPSSDASKNFDTFNFNWNLILTTIIIKYPQFCPKYNYHSAYQLVTTTTTIKLSDMLKWFPVRRHVGKHRWLKLTIDRLPAVNVSIHS